MEQLSIYDIAEVKEVKLDNLTKDKLILELEKIGFNINHKFDYESNMAYSKTWSHLGWQYEYRFLFKDIDKVVFSISGHKLSKHEIKKYKLDRYDRGLEELGFEPMKKRTLDKDSYFCIKLIDLRDKGRLEMILTDLKKLDFIN